MHDFYDHVCKIWESKYVLRHKIVLFQCEWYNTGTNGKRRMIRTNTHCTSTDVTSQRYQNDPFILPSQAKQVFYLQYTNWVNLGKLCNASNIGECLMSRKLGVENPMIIQKIVMYSNKKWLLILSLSMLETILSFVWVMLKLRLFLKVELQETLIKMKSMTYLILILIWIIICKVHNNCLKCFMLF